MITGDILATYRSPRAVIRGKTAKVREDRALATLMYACFLIFIAQWPVLSRAAHYDPTVPLEARMGATLLGVVFGLPLIAYCLAALSRICARLFGGRGTWFSARMALFWALLAASPMFLLLGLLRGFLGETTAVIGSGVLILIGFLLLWGIMLHETENP
jgi:hypothetical protein